MRKQVIAVQFFVFGVVAMVPCLVMASAIRCGDLLVTTGDTRDVVSNRCGLPADVSRSTILRQASYRRNGRIYYLDDQAIEVPVETWTYNFGPNRFMERLRFVDGVLDAIETLGYGYNDNR